MFAGQKHLAVLQGVGNAERNAGDYEEESNRLCSEE